MLRSRPCWPSIVADHGDVIFNGDGYSDQWQIEAASRGLKNLRTTVDALPELDSAEVKELFGRYDVLSERELASRYEVYLEQYHLSVVVEAKATLEMAKTVIRPAALRYQTELAQNAAALSQLGYEPDKSLLEEVSAHLADLSAGVATLENRLAAEKPEGAYAEAEHVAEGLLPVMLDIRSAADKLEASIADDLWPLPTYQEMLFIL